jgi:hypothetical protein
VVFRVIEAEFGSWRRRRARGARGTQVDVISDFANNRFCPVVFPEWEFSCLIVTGDPTLLGHFRASLARAEDCQGRHGPETGGSPVPDVAQGMGLRAVEKVQFARGTARKSPRCAVEHRVIDWASRSTSRGVRSSNHDRGCDRRDAWVGLNSWPESDYEASLGW